ncbi:MAG: hypothetical protein K2Q25_05520 [Mycobacteriaceae bacterium]|nr:hypothetical protein [Mycobacteriaceae bacterium]
MGSDFVVPAGHGERLAHIFDGQTPVIAVDLPAAVVADSGLPVVPLADVMSITEGAVVAVSSNPDTVALAQKPQPGVRKIHFVQAVHGGDEHTVRYTTMQLLASDPLVCAQRLVELAGEIKLSGGNISFTGEGTELTVRSHGQVGLIYLDDPIIKPGESVSGAVFFEIGLVAGKAAAAGTFLVNGSCRAAGMIASRDRMLSTAPEPAELVQHRREIARIGVDLHIRDNQLVACLLGERDIKDDIARWTRADGLRVTECSIGTNSQVLTGIDWSLNSMLNEGAQGIHVGFGRPVDGIHFDFICPEVALAAG